MVLSSRVRLMRNLAGHRFPSKADSSELIEVMNKVVAASRKADSSLVVEKGITSKERDRMLAQRLISPNFQWAKPGRCVILSPDRKLSLMVNEEDHLRAQCLVEGNRLTEADRRLSGLVERLSSELKFAHSSQYGFLSTSAYNCGFGRRFSVMVHLVGLGSSKSKGKVFETLLEQKVTVRGLFGEGSRPVGAFAQVSTTLASLGEFLGAVDYLLDREEAMRREVPIETLTNKSKEALDYLRSSPRISLSNAVRVLGWLRWASVESVKLDQTVELSAIDRALSSLDLLMHEDEKFADGRRADQLRGLLSL